MNLLKKSIFFILFLFVFAYGFDKILLFGLSRTNAAEWGRWNKLICGMEGADVLIMGSSRAVYHYNCRIMDSITGLKFYNIGLNSHIINYQLPLLKTYIKYNGTPRNVLLNVDISFLWIQKEIPGIEYYLNVLKEEDVYNNLSKYKPEIYCYKMIPLYGFIFTRIPIMYALNSIYNSTNINNDPLKGFEPVVKEFNDDFETFIKDKQNGYTVDFTEEGINCLKEFILFCKNKNINLITVYSPDYYQLYHYQNNRKEIKDCYSKIFAENNIEYFDLSDSSSLCYDKSLFYNSQHLNYKGANEFSRILTENERFLNAIKQDEQ